MTYMSNYGKNPSSVTGTAGDDAFYASESPGKSVTYKGGAGSDFFSVGPNDKIISETTDEDRFFFGAGSMSNVSTDELTGFNGVGVVGGDKAHFSDQDLDNPGQHITEAGGWEDLQPGQRERGQDPGGRPGRRDRLFHHLNKKDQDMSQQGTPSNKPYISISRPRSIPSSVSLMVWSAIGTASIRLSRRSGTKPTRD